MAKIPKRVEGILIMEGEPESHSAVDNFLRGLERKILEAVKDFRSSGFRLRFINLNVGQDFDKEPAEKELLVE